MNQLPLAQIYKSDLRGLSESEIFRRQSTFNFDDYYSDFRQPFGTLLAINEETLGAKNTILRQIEKEVEIILFPLFGAIVYKDSLGNEDIVKTEQIRIFSAKKGMSYELTNPYPDGLVSYLQIWIEPKKGFLGQSVQDDIPFPGKNQLFPIFKNAGSFGLIGIFDGRKEGHYTLKNLKNGLFVFVLNGAFEFENRLLEAKDGLSLSGIEKVAFEALSENALLMILEIPLQ